MERLWAPWRLEYVANATKADGCIFCDHLETIFDDEGLMLYRGESAFVVANKFPYQNGHIMVVPYRHTADFPELQADEAAEMHALLARSMNALKTIYNPEGFNLGMNLGRCAGAGVETHLHWHLLPRWNGDHNFMTTVGELRVIPEHIKTTAAKLREALQATG